MISLGQVVFVTVAFWLIVIIIASNFNLQKYNLFVSSGFLIWNIDRFTTIFDKISNLAIWKRITNTSVFIALVLLISVPLLLLVNLIRILLDKGFPIIASNPLEIFRVEAFLLVIPALFIIITLNQFYSGILQKVEGSEIDTSGFSIILFVPAFYVKMKSAVTNRRSRIKVASSLIVFNLLLLLLLFPAGWIVKNSVDGQFEDGEGVIIVEIDSSGPAGQIGLRYDEVITQFNLIDDLLVVQEIKIHSVSDFYAVLRTIEPGTEFVVQLSTGDRFTIIGANHPPGSPTQMGSYLGLTVEDYKIPRISWFPLLLPLWTEIFFSWLFGLCLFFSIYNALPFPGSQGRVIMEESLSLANIELTESSNKIILGITAILLLANIIGV